MDERFTVSCIMNGLRFSYMRNWIENGNIGNRDIGRRVYMSEEGKVDNSNGVGNDSLSSETKMR